MLARCCFRLRFYLQAVLLKRYHTPQNLTWDWPHTSHTVAAPLQLIFTCNIFQWPVFCISVTANSFLNTGGVAKFLRAAMNKSPALSRINKWIYRHHRWQWPWSVTRGTETRQLSFAKTTRDAPNIWVPGKFREPDYPTTTFPELCNGRLFRSILRTCIQNWKFVALPVPEIIGCTQKISAVPGYAHAPFSPKFLKGFCSDGPRSHTCLIWSLQLYAFLR